MATNFLYHGPPNWLINAGIDTNAKKLLALRQMLEVCASAQLSSRCITEA